MLWPCKCIKAANSKDLLKLCNEIARVEDHDERSKLKEKLPVITWQAYFEGQRKAHLAHPSGLFMLDIDHVDNPGKLYNDKIIKRVDELGIVYVGKTASCHGLRIVSKCRPKLNSLEACQKWLAANLNVEYDSVCKDWARCSYLVHDSYSYFMNAKAIWEEEPTEDEIYTVNESDKEKSAAKQATTKKTQAKPVKETIDQREGLFGGPTEYKGIPLEKIALEWLETTGGQPEPGERNIRLYKLALRMRYITDFNEATLMRIMPNFGLDEEEMHKLIGSAINATRASDLPVDLEKVIRTLKRRTELGDDLEEEIAIDTNPMPKLPPVIQQFVDITPDDFKEAVALCQLPILGTLASRLRAKYLDGTMHSPSFQISLEAPQASGKSFMRRLCEYELAAVITHDEEQRQKEHDYDNKVKELKLLNIKVNVDNKDEVLGSRPKTLIRYVPATMSVTKLLMRMDAAQGLHLFALAEEIDTVTKTFKRGFSSYSDLLRVSFDNGMYGQDYASENSFSGNIRLYYNMLTSGTPKAMRRFYPDVEDGLVSRVLFVTLPDQFGKKMPVWEEFSEEQKSLVDRKLVDLNEISIVGDKVQPEHELKMDWLNKELQSWLQQQQIRAVKENDRTRDIFCRRAAVVGFRAGMLAYFLYEEKRAPHIYKYVKKFALWVANYMLKQHILRFEIKDGNSNTTPYNEALALLPKNFTRKQAKSAAETIGYTSRLSDILYKWQLAKKSMSFTKVI